MRIFLSFLFLSLALAAGVTAQEEAIDFTMRTYEDPSTQKLSDFRGEVLYVSFWATWCKPCIANFKKYADIRSSLEEMGVTFLNVNIDDEEEKWIAYLRDNPINGINARPSELALVKDIYQLYSIPYYEIIDKKGRVRYLSDAPDRDIFEEFRNLLNE